MTSPNSADLTLIAIHYNSKVNWSDGDQAAQSSMLKHFIDGLEKRLDSKRTVVCGDFNMNPFDSGMVQSTGLHSVMERRTAQRLNRMIEGINYEFFYNPMWGFLGDLGKGKVSGTHYFSPARPINYHCHLYDQVLIRPELIPAFVDDELEILTQIGDICLLTESGVLSGRYSDHLPIKFEMNV